MFRPPPIPTLFPYTTLFRSPHARPAADRVLLPPRPGHVRVQHRRQPDHSGGLQPHGLVGPEDDGAEDAAGRSEEHTSELQSHSDLVCRLLLEKKKNTKYYER